MASKMTFQVQWVGWDSTTTEPWSKEVSYFEPMHEYLRSKVLVKLISAMFKTTTNFKK